MKTTFELAVSELRPATVRPALQELPTGFRKVGTVYAEFRGKPCYRYRCGYLRNPALDGVHDGCCHRSCRMQMLREAGHGDVADKLEANAEARDWLHNWGKMVYDPNEHGKQRGTERRKLAARLMRQMVQKKLGYADVVVTGCWAGALMEKTA